MKNFIHAYGDVHYKAYCSDCRSYVDHKKELLPINLSNIFEYDQTHTACARCGTVLLTKQQYDEYTQSAQQAYSFVDTLYSHVAILQQISRMRLPGDTRNDDTKRFEDSVTAIRAMGYTPYCSNGKWIVYKTQEKKVVR